MLALEETCAEYRESGRRGGGDTRIRAAKRASAGEIHEALLGFAQRRAADALKLLRWLRLGAEKRVHESLGLSSLSEYCSRLFGWTGRQTRERLRVARALDESPRTAGALGDGALTYTAVRELTRVATSETEEAWLEWAMRAGIRRTGHEVQQKVARHARGAPPDSPPAPFEERRVRVVLEMSGSEAARYSALRAEAVRRLGEGVEDEMFARMLFDAFEAAGTSEGAKADGGAAPHQVRLTVCERCGATEREAGAEGNVPVDPRVGEVALCDAQLLRPGERATQTVPPAHRRAVLRREEGRCAVPGCRHAAFLHVHHVERRSDGGSHHLANLLALCSLHHDAAHEGRLLIRHDPAVDGCRFERADGACYGSMSGSRRAVQRCKSHADEFGQMVRQGHTERDARRELDARRREGAALELAATQGRREPHAKVVPRGRPALPDPYADDVAPRGREVPETAEPTKAVSPYAPGAGRPACPQGAE